jgi:AcrR family transcriptional regulator
VGAARTLAERDGLEALTLRRLAGELGIQAPSLYKHFPDKAALLAAIAAEVGTELARLLAVWSQERGGDLARLARGYRRFTQEHHHLLSLLVPTEEAVTAVAAKAGNRERALAFLAMAQGLAALGAADEVWDAGTSAFEKRA